MSRVSQALGVMCPRGVPDASLKPRLSSYQTQEAASRHACFRYSAQRPGDAAPRLRSVTLDVSMEMSCCVARATCRPEPDGQLLLCWSVLAFSWKDESQMVFKATQQARCALWQNLTLPRLPTWYTYAGDKIDEKVPAVRVDCK